jgi:hypothetical protein
MGDSEENEINRKETEKQLKFLAWRDRKASFMQKYSFWTPRKRLSMAFSCGHQAPPMTFLGDLITWGKKEQINRILGKLKEKAGSDVLILALRC